MCAGGDPVFAGRSPVRHAGAMILVLGDRHADWLALQDAIERAVGDDGVSTVFQVGDFGFFQELFASLERQLRKRPWPVPVHVIDGNHEDHRWLWRQGDDGTFARWSRDYNLHVHRRGETATLEGVSTGFVGGALHADRPQQGSPETGTSNYLTDQEADRAAEAIEAAQVDLLITHSCPHSIGVGIQGSPAFSASVELFIRGEGFSSGPIEDCGEPALTRLWHRLRRRPPMWAFGHFHRHAVSRVATTTFRCVGSVDGSDRRSTTLGHVLDPQRREWSQVEL